jgi:ubiquinone/menaquinone biosynthesis C-methylase UbiE
MTEDHTQRFTGRALAYSRYRPTYPKQVLDILRKEAGFDSKKIVADVGSGTGILSKLFLENGNKVFGIEPNDDMRKIAESSLSSHKRFVSVKGTAENTTLGDQTVDFISVAQALHWFDPERSWKEFKRIIGKEGGYLCIVYNDRKTEGDNSNVMKEYEDIIEKYGKNKPKLERVEDENLSQFFREWTSFRKFSTLNYQTLDFEGLLGRASSASYMPQPNEEGFTFVKKELEEIFAKYQKDNKVKLTYETNIFLGPL